MRQSDTPLYKREPHFRGESAEAAFPFGGSPTDRQPGERIDATIYQGRVAGLGTCSKCDDHNKPCVCPQGCDCEGPHGR